MSICMEHIGDKVRQRQANNNNRKDNDIWQHGGFKEGVIRLTSESIGRRKPCWGWESGIETRRDLCKNTHMRSSMLLWRTTKQFWNSWCIKFEAGRDRWKLEQGMSHRSCSRMSALTCRWWGTIKAFNPLS